MQTIEIQKSTYKRLVSHIEDFSETEDSVINKALNALEKQKKKKTSIKKTQNISTTQLQFNPNKIPNTFHSKLVNMKIDGVKTHAQNWVDLLNAFVKIAIDQGLSSHELKRRYTINLVKNPQNQSSYRFAPEFGAWIQRLSSVHIVEKVQNMAKDFNIEVEIEVKWFEKSKAQFPGCNARIKIN